MRGIEAKIKESLMARGIKCHTVYTMPDPDELRVLIAFNSQKNPRLTTKRIERILNEMGTNEFSVPKDFQRLSATFLHLEVKLGARTEQKIEVTAQ
ncbi:MAG: hypothetical protein P1Q69_05475 [Candidatus Thorarchaeota archaeon]|nr:hypothetical protein [Candidatus Thorarchaeota archaeon]